MLADMFVINGVVHAFNADPKNLTNPHTPLGRSFAERILLYHKKFSQDNEYRLSPEEYARDHSIEDLAHALFAESPCDMAIFHSIPLYDFFKDGLVSWEKGVAMKEKYPDRVLHYGRLVTLDVTRALKDIEFQVKEHGVDGFKVYPATFYEGRTLAWRMDDPRLAYPLYEKALELGVTNFAVHKAHPFGPTQTHAYRPEDVEEPAALFPEMNFQIVHAGMLFVEETAAALARFPNVYGNMEISWSYLNNSPRLFAESLGKMLYWASADKIIFGDGCTTQHSRPTLEKFLEFQMPEDLVEEYGYPRLTMEDKAKILGLNMAKLHGIDIEARKKKIAGDKFEQLKKDGYQQPWKLIRDRAAAEREHAA
ncbi:MAG: amidohydrolase family protein [Azospirillaceae bacterium]